MFAFKQSARGVGMALDEVNGYLVAIRKQSESGAVHSMRNGTRNGPQFSTGHSVGGAGTGRVNQVGTVVAGIKEGGTKRIAPPRTSDTSTISVDGRAPIPVQGVGSRVRAAQVTEAPRSITPAPRTHTPGRGGVAAAGIMEG